MRSPLYLHVWLQNIDPARKVFHSPRIDEQRLRIPAMNSCNPPQNDGEKSDDGFVAVNVAELGVAVDRPPATPRNMSKSLSRKGGPPRSGSGSGSGGGGGGGGGEVVSVLTLDGPAVKDKPLYVAVEGEAEVAATAAAAINRHRRAATGRRPSAWRDPRRVLLVFASLSCMGTLILLYFTLAMSRMNTGTSVDDDSG